MTDSIRNDVLNVLMEQGLLTPAPNAHSHWLEQALDLKTVALVCIVTGVCWVVVMMATVVDFTVAVQRAKVLGIPRSSKGFRRSFPKLVWYYALLTLFGFLDMMFVLAGSISDSFDYRLPWAGMVCSVVIVGIEIKSVLEKGSKSQRDDLADIVVGIGAFAQRLTEADKKEAATEFVKALGLTEDKNDV